MTQDELKKWVSDNKVLFVTNSTLRPGGTFLASLKCYVDYIPMHNLAVIPGTKTTVMKEGRQVELPRYGVDVFDEMTYRIMKDPVWRVFDYIVYIDDDCFVKDFEGLMDVLEEFIESGCCLAGPQDGGVFSHRNHSQLMINTFLSFWNAKLMREKCSLDVYQNILKDIYSSKEPYKTFLGALSNDLEDLMCSKANEKISVLKDYRKRNFSIKKDDDGWTSYAEVVTNDKDNPVEPHQTPYSYKEEAGNFEPYYVVEQAWVLGTKAPIMYFNATDYYDATINDEETDNSGLTSAVYGKDMNLLAVHTWFSRFYSKVPQNQLMLKHTIRTNKVISQIGKI